VLILEVREGRADWLQAAARRLRPGRRQRLPQVHPLGPEAPCKPETVTVLAGGWSARQYLDRLEGTIIGVNDAAIFSPCRHRRQHGPAVDRAPLGPPGRDRQAGLAAPIGAEEHPPAAAGLGRSFDLRPHLDRLSTDVEGVLNGTHSGFCALNLAYQMRPQRLVLVGFDMGKGPGGEAHWWPDYPWAKPGGATTGGKFKAWAASSPAPPPVRRRRRRRRGLGRRPPSPVSRGPRERPDDLPAVLHQRRHAGPFSTPALARLPAELQRACDLIVVDDGSPSRPGAALRRPGRPLRPGRDLPHHRRRPLEPGRGPQPGRPPGPHRLAAADRHRPRPHREALEWLTTTRKLREDTVYRFGQRLDAPT
jgi:hypothetical protein